MTVLLYLHHHTFISKKLYPCHIQDYRLYIIVWIIKGHIETDISGGVTLITFISTTSVQMRTLLEYFNFINFILLLHYLSGENIVLFTTVVVQ